MTSSPPSPPAALTSASVLLSIVIFVCATLVSASSSHTPENVIKSENDHLVNVVCETRVWKLLDTAVTVPFFTSPLKASLSPMLQTLTPVNGTLEVCL